MGTQVDDSPIGLEEYEALQAEILAYSQQRTAILATVVGAVGAVLVFGFDHDASAAILALYMILIGGALLTYNGLYQATRRATYIQVFIERRMQGLRWYTAMRREGRGRFELSIRGRRIGAHPAWIPHEYPVMYLLMAATGLVYAAVLWASEDRSGPTIIAAIGCIGLGAVLVGLQFVNSAYGFEALANRWERIRDELEKESKP